MQRRILANLASFYTEQQSLDVKDGPARRVQCGLFIGEAPYEYRNIRLAEKPASDCVPYSVTVSTSARSYSRSACDAAGQPVDLTQRLR